MSNVSMKFGLSSSMRGLLNRAGKSVEDALSKAAPDAVRAVTDYISVYPPERPKQTYQRTYRLLTGWWNTIEFLNKGSKQQTLAITIGNDASDHRPGRAYGGYVVGPWSGPIQQANIHRRRWPTISGMKREVSPLVQSIFRDAIYQEMRFLSRNKPTAMVDQMGFDRSMTNPDYWFDLEAGEGARQRQIRKKIDSTHSRRGFVRGSRIKKMEIRNKRVKALKNTLMEDAPNRRDRHLSDIQRAHMEARERESLMTYPPTNPRKSPSAKGALSRAMKTREAIRHGDEAYSAMTRTAHDKDKRKK